MTKSILKRAFLAFLVLIIATGLLVSGCPTPEETTTPPPTGATTPPPTETTTPPPSGPQYGGTLTIIQPGEVIGLGYPPDCGGPEVFYQRLPALENLLIVDEEGHIVPFLAESYEEDPENLTATFGLREGVKFHDGSILDAEVCKWNLEQLMDGSNTSGDFENVSSIEIVDDYTVQVKFSEWKNTWGRYMAWDAYMISKDAFEKNGKDWAFDNPVGTGPFKLVSWERDIQKVYERFDDYWQPGKPYLDRIIINLIADPMVQYASFLAGEADILTALNWQDAATLEGEPGVVIASATLQGGDTQSLIPDSAVPESPFAELKVREAVSLAIDREELADIIFAGYAFPACQLGYETQWGYNPNIECPLPYDPDRARELLAEAGYPDGFETEIYCRNEQAIIDMVTAIQDYLLQVGIKAEVRPLEMGAFFGLVYGQGWPAGTLAVIPDGCDVDAAVYMQLSYGEGMPVMVNKLVYKPQEVLDAVNASIAATDFATKKQLVWDLQEMVYEKYYMHIPIVVTQMLAAKSSKVHDEYTCLYDSEPVTFADAWIEE